MIWTVKKGTSTHTLSDGMKKEISTIRVKKGGVYTVSDSSGVSVLSISGDGPLSIRGIAGEGAAVLHPDGSSVLVWNHMELTVTQNRAGDFFISRGQSLIGAITGMTEKNVCIEMKEHGTPEFAALLFVLAHRMTIG